MKIIAGGLLALALFAGTAAPVAAEETPSFDLGGFVRTNHLHVIAGYTTLGLALATGTAAVFEWPVHPYLGYTTMGSGLITLALGLTAYSNRLDEVWPHVLFVGLAETGWLLNAFVWEPGSLPHKITGAASIASLAAGYVAIRLING